MFLNAKSVDITKTEEQKEEEISEDDGSDSEEEWQEDQEIDWEKGIDISEDTEWEDDDVELAESDEA